MSALFSGPQDTPGEVKQAGVSCLPASLPLPSDQLAYSCFSLLMKRMSQNFPNGGAMDIHFANMRSLIQILDSELFELMHQNGDYTHFYFCYRWFLLDFKRGKRWVG